MGATGAGAAQNQTDSPTHVERHFRAKTADSAYPAYSIDIIIYMPPQNNSRNNRCGNKAQSLIY